MVTSVICSRQCAIRSPTRGRTTTLWMSSCPTSFRSGNSLFKECVRTLELPNLNASSVADFRRVVLKPSNTSKRLRPRTEEAERPEALAIQSFQLAILRCSSMTITPPSMALRTDCQSNIEASERRLIDTGLDTLEIVGDDSLQRGD